MSELMNPEEFVRRETKRRSDLAVKHGLTVDQVVFAERMRMDVADYARWSTVRNAEDASRARAQERAVVDVDVEARRQIEVEKRKRELEAGE